LVDQAKRIATPSRSEEEQKVGKVVPGHPVDEFLELLVRKRKHSGSARPMLLSGPVAGRKFLKVGNLSRRVREILGAAIGRPEHFPKAPHGHRRSVHDEDMRMQKPIVGFGAVGGLKAANRRRPGKARASETLAKLIAGMGKMRFMQMAAAVGSKVHRHDPMFRERRVLDRSEDLAGEPDAIMAPANWAKRKLAPKVPGKAIAKINRRPPKLRACRTHQPSDQLR
jgi:hypothetical protein